jgi:hypothetical protein
VDECTVFDPDAKSYIGKDDPEQAGRWLYANFCKYQSESGHKSVLPVKRFSANLRDLLKNQLRAAINEGRDRGGAYIQGIGLRCYYDPNLDRYNTPITGEGECDGFEGECDGLVTAETRMGDGCDGCDGFFEVHQSSPKNAALEEPQDLVEGNAENKVERYRENPSHPSHPSPVSIPAIENPSPDPSHQEVVAIAPTATSKSEPIQVGDRVALVTDPTKIGTVQKIDPEFRRPYNVVFDDPITAENYVFHEDWVTADQLRGLVDS